MGHVFLDLVQFELEIESDMGHVRILIRTIEEISSVENCFSSPLYCTTIIGLSPEPGITLYGHILISLWTEASENRLPIRRLASAEIHKKETLSESSFEHIDILIQNSLVISQFKK